MPLLLKIDAENGNTIGVWQANESVDELSGMLDLHKDDKKTLNGFRLESRKKEWLAVRVLLKELAGEEHRIMYKKNGAPFLKNSDLHIGISHTKGFAGVAIAPFPVSLDMEKASPRIERVYQRFVNETEEAFIPENEKTDYYNLIWTAKETLFKLYDRQDVVFKENFLIEPFILSEKGAVKARVMFDDFTAQVLMHYEILPEFTLTYYIKSSGK